jgi:hypothetical protein
MQKPQGKFAAVLMAIYDFFVLYTANANVSQHYDKRWVDCQAK